MTRKGQIYIAKYHDHFTDFPWVSGMIYIKNVYVYLKISLES